MGTMSLNANYKKCKQQIKFLSHRIHTILNQHDDSILSKLNSSMDTDTETKQSEVDNNNRKSKGDAAFVLRKTLHGHQDKVYALKWSSDSMNVVSASRDGSLIIWDMQKYTKILGIPL